MRARLRTVSTVAMAVATAMLAAACTATPLPTPPTASPERMEIRTETPGRVRVVGLEGAVDPPGTRLRVTSAFMDWDELIVRDDGSFIADLLGDPVEGIYYLEAVLGDEDRFLVAIARNADGATRVIDVSDEDGDGSPDAIDCAPGDRTLAGRRCPPVDGLPYCVVRPEACNGLDDDCNRIADDGCSGACADELDCADALFCIDAACVRGP